MSDGVISFAVSQNRTPGSADAYNNAVVSDPYLLFSGECEIRTHDLLSASQVF